MPFHSAAAVSAVCGRLVLPFRDSNLPVLTNPDLRCLKCHGGDRPSRNSNLPSKRHQPNKLFLKAKDAVREQLSSLSLSALLDADDIDPDKLLPGQAIGLVVSAQANFMRVVVECASDGDSASDSDLKIGVELLCVVRAVLKKIKERVLVGDKVLVGSVDWVAKRGMIENVFKRETEIMDPPLANVNHLLVFFSLQQPDAEPFTLTRFLVEAESTGLSFTLAMNKVDLVSQEEISSWKTRLRSWGYEPLFCSVSKQLGLVDLDTVLKGKTTVVVGPSGVGKSNLINVIRGIHLGARDGQTDCRSRSEHDEDEKYLECLPVGSVSRRSGRGKHTTRHVSLLPLSEEGYIADTPGFSHPNLTKVSKKTLAHMFPEVRRAFDACEPERCSFNDCLHLGEPGCVVNADWERYPYYIKLLNEIKIREEVYLRTLGTKRESNVRHKVGARGVQQLEPRLELKKHRRVSRKRINQRLLDEYDDDREDGPGND